MTARSRSLCGSAASRSIAGGVLVPQHERVKASEDRKNVSAYGVFQGTHTGQGGPVPPTGKSLRTDYVVMFFEGDRIKHVQRIWRAGLAMKELGWIT